MATIYLAANYIDLTDIFVNDPDGIGIPDVGYGHLQLVMGDQEIEVQAPTDF